MSEASKVDFVAEFTKKLVARDAPFEYLYQHRNDMTQEQFEDCVLEYGNQVRDSCRSYRHV